MTLDEAVAAVTATLDSPDLRVDRLRVHEDATSYLLIVLDASGGRRAGPVDNGPRLVDKVSGTVTRLTVPEALDRAARMTSTRPQAGSDTNPSSATDASASLRGTTRTV